MTTTATIIHGTYSFTFNDNDVVNADEYEYGIGTQKMFLFHDHGVTLAVVFADNLRDALDIAVDNDRLDRYLVEESDLVAYGEDEDGIVRLGNASEPFDIELLGIVELPPPPFSIVALYNGWRP